MKARGLWAAAALGTLLLAACGDDTGGDDDDRGPLGGNGADSSAAATPAAPASGRFATDSGGGVGESLPAIDPARRIVFTASIVLNASDVGRAFTDAGSLARTNGGYIEQSSFASGPDGGATRSASLTIRVPVQNYDTLVASLRTLNGVTVANEGSSSSEVTDQYIDLQSRLRNLERTEQQYLELLGRAVTIPDILTLQDRLASVRGQIEQIQGRLKVLENQTDFATVNVSIAPVVAAKQPAGDEWSLKGVLVGSWVSSLEVARYVAATGVVALVAAGWLAVPMGLGLFGARRLRRRSHAGPVAAVEGS